MKSIWLVMRQEVFSTVTRRSFQLTAFGVPLIALILFTAVSLVIRSAPGAVPGLLNPAKPSSSIAEGFVDLSGLIEALPIYVSADEMRAYQDEISAQRAMLAEEISAYYLIPEDYITRGQVVYVTSDFNPIDAFNQGKSIDQVLRLNLLHGDNHLSNLVANPFALQVMIQNPTNRFNQGSSLAFLIPYLVMLLYYMLILMSAGFLVSSLNKERENRVLEIMLLTITPRQLLAGKFIGLGLMGLLVNFLWVGSAYGLMVMSGSTFQLPAEMQLDPYILLWGAVYFLLGYAVYASLLGAVGAMLPNLRETSQATMIVILPMIIPLMVITLLISQPNGVLAIALSLFPLTAPVTMMLRLTVTAVPSWQLLLSVIILLLTAILILRFVARIFHGQTLLSGQPLSLRNIYRMVFGKV